LNSPAPARPEEFAIKSVPLRQLNEPINTGGMKNSGVKHHLAASIKQNLPDQ